MSGGHPLVFMSFFVSQKRSYYYAKNKVSKCHFYDFNGIRYGLLHECIYHLAQIRCVE